MSSPAEKPLDIKERKIRNTVDMHGEEFTAEEKAKAVKILLEFSEHAILFDKHDHHSILTMANNLDILRLMVKTDVSKTLRKTPVNRLHRRILIIAGLLSNNAATKRAVITTFMNNEVKNSQSETTKLMGIAAYVGDIELFKQIVREHIIKLTTDHKSEDITEDSINKKARKLLPHAAAFAMAGFRAKAIKQLHTMNFKLDPTDSSIPVYRLLGNANPEEKDRIISILKSFFRLHKKERLNNAIYNVKIAEAASQSKEVIEYIEEKQNEAARALLTEAIERKTATEDELNETKAIPDYKTSIAKALQTKVAELTTTAAKIELLQKAIAKGSGDNPKPANAISQILHVQRGYFKPKTVNNIKKQIEDLRETLAKEVSGAGATTAAGSGSTATAFSRGNDPATLASWERPNAIPIRRVPRTPTKMGLGLT